MDHLEWCWSLQWGTWVSSERPYTSNVNDLAPKYHITLPYSSRAKLFTWPHSHMGTRKYNPTICLDMCLEVEGNWDICQIALMTTTVKLRTNQPRSLFLTYTHNPAEILPYWGEGLIIKIPKVTPHPSLWLLYYWLEQPSTVFCPHGGSRLQIWLTNAFTFHIL